MENKEGQKVPQVTFKTRQNDQWVDVTTDELFKGKKVVLFALPGAFTPTCSSSHLPRYNQLVPTFKKLGVDRVICLSVNDTFVMNAWQADQEAWDVFFLPDGNAEFSQKLGMACDKSNIGFGERSWRYSMFVEDATIKKMFIEPVKDGDPFEVSDADTMLKYLGPNAEAPKSIMMFSKPGCPYCAKAKSLLEQKGWAYEEIVMGKDATVTALAAASGKLTVPQVFINGKLIGGSVELEQYLKG